MVATDVASRGIGMMKCGCASPLLPLRPLPFLVVPFSARALMRSV